MHEKLSSSYMVLFKRYGLGWFFRPGLKLIVAVNPNRITVLMLSIPITQTAPQASLNHIMP